MSDSVGGFERAAPSGPATLMLTALLPLALFLFLYSPAAEFEFAWLDRMEIQDGGGILPPGDWLSAFTRPVHVGGGDGAVSNPYYRPLQLVVTNAIYHYVGQGPRVFHVTALVFGALTILGFTALAWLLFRQAMPVLIAGLVVAAHPAGIEPYVWISATSTAMSALFLMVSLIGAKLYLDAKGDAPIALLVISVLAMVAAMLSKEKGVLVPILLIALLIGVHTGGRRGSRAVFERDFSVVRDRADRLIRYQLLAAIIFLFFLRPLVVGTVGSISPIGGSYGTHVLTALASWPDALSWLVLPLQSTTSDVVHVVSAASDWRVWLGVGLLLVSLSAWYLLARAGRSAAAFGLAWIWLAFLPTANLVPILHAHAERYLYLSVFGLALLVAGVAAWVLDNSRRIALRPVVITVALVAVAALGSRTYERIPDWRSTRTLFSSDVGRDPDYREGLLYLAVDSFDERRYREADRYLDDLIPLLEDFSGKTSYIAPSDVFELGCLNALASGRPARAEQLVRRGMRVSPKLSRDADVQRCLRMARGSGGDQAAAGVSPGDASP